MKQTFTFLLSALALLLFFPAHTRAQDLTINTLAQLKAFRDDVNQGNDYAGKTILLAADIDLADDNDKDWTPIGTAANPFKGTFKGNGKTIKNLYINRPNAFHIGLFGNINAATLENIRLENATVKGLNNVGGLAGNAASDGKISNCSVVGKGIIEGISNVGGLTGANESDLIRCYTTINVTASGNKAYLGGVVGNNYKGSLSQCYATGAVSATGDNVRIGGVVGYNDNNGSISQCYAICTLSATGAKNDVGGVVGYSSNISISQCYFLKGSAKQGIGNDNTSTEATALDLTAMGIKGSFAGWTFDKDNWTMQEGKTAPYFVWQPAETIPYLPIITTLAELKAFRDNVNNGTDYAGKTILLAADIDLKGEEWTPIGKLGKPFKGTFNGNGNTIRNLKIDQSDGTYLGLFGWIEAATLENLRLENATVKGDRFVGGLAGFTEAKSKISNCSVVGKGLIEGKDNTGGLTGVNSGELIHCYTTIDVTASNNDARVGGIVGYNHNGSLSQCYATGTVTANGTAAFVGGVVGYNLTGPLSQCYSISMLSVSSGAPNTGGVAGLNDKGSLTQCYFLKGSTEKGIGANVGATMEAPALDLAAMATKNSYEGWIFDKDNWTMQEGKTAPYFDGQTEETIPYLPIITTLAELKAFRDNVNNGTDYAGKTILLGADIDLKGEEWTPIGTEDNLFKGTFNGNGKTIKNLTINQPKKDALGLFGLIEGATLENLRLENAIVKGKECVGGLAAYVDSQSKISNSSVVGEGRIEGANYVGGLTGWNAGELTRCYTSIDVMANEKNAFVGGVVGYNYGSLSQCYATGAVSATGDNVRIGGVVGSNYSSLSQCYATGAVSATGDNVSIGGVVGYNFIASSLSQCYATGTVSASGNKAYLGGVVGNNNGGSISQCYAMTALSATGTDSYVGGVVGYGNKISISQCYFLKGSAEQGIGNVKTSTEATALDLATMGIKDSFEGWTFDNDNWSIQERVTAPYFAWQPAGTIPYVSDPSLAVYHTIRLTRGAGITSNYATGNMVFEDGGYLHLTFTPDDRNLTADDILLVVDGKEATFGESNGQFYYFINPIEKNHDVTLALRRYPVSLTLPEGAAPDALTLESPATADYGKPYTLRFRLAPAYDPAHLALTLNGESLSFNCQLKGDAPIAGDGTLFTATIDNVEGPLDLVVTSLGETVGNLSIAPGDIQIAMDNGQLTIDNLGMPTTLYIYTLAGRLHLTQALPTGTTTVALPPGAYILRTGKTTHKLLVR